MGTITFGGLATGLDTNEIINGLMEVERRPIERLEQDKAWMNNRLTGYTAFDAQLASLKSALSRLSSIDTLESRQVSLSDEGLFTARAGNDAVAGATYDLEVVSLAKVEKSVSQGYADKSASGFGTGSLVIQVGSGSSHTIDITDENNSLEGISKAINDADIGVQAAIINDGTGAPYRLVITGKEAGEDIALNVTLSGGSLDPLTFTESQQATQAHIRVDNIDIYSKNNTIKDAIPGVSLDLQKAEAGKTVSLKVSKDTRPMLDGINAFVKRYNAAVSFVTGQSKMGADDEAGLLAGDAGLNSVKRKLQGLLTTMVDTSGSFKALSQLGLETQKDGTLNVDELTLKKAVVDSTDDVAKLLTGENDTDGIISQFESYLDKMTDSETGLLAGRKMSIEAGIKRADRDIEQARMRLASKEEVLRNRFIALEKLVSGMNSQSAFLTQQMNMLTSMMSGKKS